MQPLVPFIIRVAFDGVNKGDIIRSWNSFIQTSHYFSKKLDEFEVGDHRRILAFIKST